MCSAQTTSDLKVFLVEDSPLLAERIERMLDSVPGAKSVGRAEGAQAAIAAILENRPDVVVLDLTLAQGSGYDVLRAVKAADPGIDFYVLTNYASDPHRHLAGRLGASEFFDKSTEFGRMRERLAERARPH